MKDATDITIILDRSGSMQSCRDDTIGGFNQFLKTHQDLEGDCNLTLVQFDSQDAFELIHRGKPVRDVPPLDAGTYVPRGGTPLLDAVGRAINDTGQRLGEMSEDDRPDKVLFVVLTDGQENSSHEFTKQNVKKMVDEQQNNWKWNFVFLGAEIDAFDEAAGIGIAAGQAIPYDKGHTIGVFTALSANTAAYRSTGARSDLDWTEKQRKDLN